MGFMTFIGIIAIIVGIVFALRGENLIGVFIVVAGLALYFIMSSFLSNQTKILPSTVEHSKAIYEADDGRMRQQIRVNPDGSVTSYESMAGGQ